VYRTFCVRVDQLADALPSPDFFYSCTYFSIYSIIFFIIAILLTIRSCEVLRLHLMYFEYE